MYSNILIPVDLDEPGSWSRALPVAMALAQCYGAKLTLGTIVTDQSAANEALWSAAAYREMIDIAKARLAGLAAQAGMDGIESRVGTGSIHGGILTLAKEIEADLIVLASHHPAMKDYLIGANAAHVVRHAQCSVFVVRN